MKRIVQFASTSLLLLVLVACGNDSPTATIEVLPEAAISENTPLSPEQTLAKLKELAEAGDWETYVDDFYGESHKFEGKAERRDAVVARFRDKWADQVLEGFEALDDADAVISEDGKKAVFTKDGEPSFNLFMSDEGHWTFHL